MKRKGISLRRVVQIFFLLLITLIAVNHTLEERGIEIPLVGSASLHAVCPFGGVVSIYQYAAAGTFTKKIHESSFILMIIVFALALAFGPVFCGWICPLGTVQEFISRIGRRIFGKRHNSFIPRAADRYLRYLRYLVLGLGHLRHSRFRGPGIRGLRSLLRPLQLLDRRGSGLRFCHSGPGPAGSPLC